MTTLDVHVPSQIDSSIVGQEKYIPTHTHKSIQQRSSLIRIQFFVGFIWKISNGIEYNTTKPKFNLTNVLNECDVILLDNSLHVLYLER